MQEKIFSGLSLKVHNKGIFATSTEIGEPNIWTRIMRLISRAIRKDRPFSADQRFRGFSRLQGNESAEFSWLISGKGKIGISAGSANIGEITTSVELK